MASEVIRIGASRSRAPRSTSAGPNSHALVLFEVLAVVDQQDAVAGSDAEDGEEPDQRAEGDDATARPGREHAADQRHRQGQEDEHRQPPPPERRLQQEQDRAPGDERRLEQPALRRLPLLVLAEELDVVPAAEVDRWPASA